MNKRLNNKITLALSIYFILYTLYFIPAVAFAQEKSRFIDCDPALAPGAPGGCGIPAFVQFIRNVITFLLEIAIPIGTVFIIYGAFVIMTAGGSEEKVKKGRGIIYAAVIGLVIALGSWLIVTTINNILRGGLI